jgi:hypothetical protein
LIGVLTKDTDVEAGNPDVEAGNEGIADTFKSLNL